MTKERALLDHEGGSHSSSLRRCRCFALDHDHQVSEELRFVQLTPPGSACSIALTTGAHQMAPGSLEGMQLVVDDADAARVELLERGVEVSEIQTFPWGRFVFFTDPDGNGWSVQQIQQ